MSGGEYEAPAITDGERDAAYVAGLREERTNVVKKADPVEALEPTALVTVPWVPKDESPTAAGRATQLERRVASVVVDDGRQL